MTSRDRISLEIRELARWWPLILVPTLIALAAAIWSVSQQQPTYTATTRLQVAPLSQYDETFLGTSLVRDAGDAKRTAITLAALLDSHQAATAAATQLGSSWTPQAVEDAIRISAVQNANLIDIAADTGDPDSAVRVSEAFAKATVEGRWRVIAAELDGRIATLTAAVKESALGETATRLQTLKVIREAGADPTLRLGPTTSAVQNAHQPAVVVLGLAAAGGLFIGVLAALGMTRWRRRPHDGNGAGSTPIPEKAPAYSPAVQEIELMPRLMGMPINSVTLEEAVNRVLDGVAHGSGGTVITPNIDILRQYRSSPPLQDEFERTDLLVADGMPIVVALRLQRTPVPRQITGTDLLWAISAGAADRGYSIMLAGGQPGDADRAANRLRDRNPGLLVQTRPCYVLPDTETQEISSLSETLIATRPDIAFIGLPFRTQVTVMSQMRAKMPGTWLVGIGSSFELVSGDRTRPPQWVQRMCLEWVWRLTRQPQLWRRYLIDGMPIAAHLLAAALRVRWQRKSDAAKTSAKRPA